MSKKKTNKIAEEKAFDYQRALGMIDSVSDDHVIARRMGFYDGFIAGAEWGEKNAYKAIMKKADEVRDKRFDADYEVKIEPAAGFDLGCVNVYREGKLVGQYVEPKEEKKPSEGVEEAAKRYDEAESWRWEAPKYPRREAFEAGAKWQKRQIMRNAVEGEVCILPGHVAYVKEKDNESLKQYLLDHFKTGNKVRIIIIKEEEQ